MDNLDLIAVLGVKWKELRAKYPDEQDRRGWTALAIGLAIRALMEEEYGGKEALELELKKIRLAKRERKP